MSNVIAERLRIAPAVAPAIRRDSAAENFRPEATGDGVRRYRTRIKNEEFF